MCHFILLSVSLAPRLTRAVKTVEILQSHQDIVGSQITRCVHLQALQPRFSGRKPGLYHRSNIPQQVVMHLLYALVPALIASAQAGISGRQSTAITVPYFVCPESLVDTSMQTLVCSLSSTESREVQAGMFPDLSHREVTHDPPRASPHANVYTEIDLTSFSVLQLLPLKHTTASQSVTVPETAT